MKAFWTTFIIFTFMILMFISVGDINLARKNLRYLKSASNLSCSQSLKLIILFLNGLTIIYLGWASYNLSSNFKKAQKCNKKGANYQADAW